MNSTLSSKPNFPPVTSASTAARFVGTRPIVSGATIDQVCAGLRFCAEVQRDRTSRATPAGKIARFPGSSIVLENVAAIALLCREHGARNRVPGVPAVFREAVAIVYPLPSCRAFRAATDFQNVPKPFCAFSFLLLNHRTVRNKPHGRIPFG